MKTITDGSAVFTVRDKRMKSMIDFFYPIGSVYVSADKSKTKADFPIMNYGTWEEIPANLCLQTGSVGEAGTQRRAGLPDINGTMTSIMWTGNANNNGVYTFNREFPDRALEQRGSSSTAPRFDDIFVYFKASTSNSIYGASNTVQPPAYMVRAWVRTA